MEERPATRPKDLSGAFRDFFNIVHNLKSAVEYSAKTLALRRALALVTGELEAKGASTEGVAMLKTIAEEGADAEEGLQRALTSMDSRLEQAASEIQHGVRDLQDEIEGLKGALQERLSRPVRQPAQRKWFQILMYPTALLIFVGITAALVSQQKAETPTVEISYEIGSIIQGVLAGIGILVAGGAYAAKTLSAAKDAEQE